MYLTIPIVVLYADSAGELFDFCLKYMGDSSRLKREEWLLPLLLLAESESRPRNYKNDFVKFHVLYRFESSVIRHVSCIPL